MAIRIQLGRDLARVMMELSRHTSLRNIEDRVLRLRVPKEVDDIGSRKIVRHPAPLLALPLPHDGRDLTDSCSSSRTRWVLYFSTHTNRHYDRSRRCTCVDLNTFSVARRRESDSGRGSSSRAGAVLAKKRIKTRL